MSENVGKASFESEIPTDSVCDLSCVWFLSCFPFRLPSYFLFWFSVLRPSAFSSRRTRSKEKAQRTLPRNGKTVFSSRIHLLGDLLVRMPGKIGLFKKRRQKIFRRKTTIERVGSIPPIDDQPPDRPARRQNGRILGKEKIVFAKKRKIARLGQNFRPVGKKRARFRAHIKRSAAFPNKRENTLAHGAVAALTATVKAHSAAVVQTNTKYHNAFSASIKRRAPSV